MRHVYLADSKSSLADIVGYQLGDSWREGLLVTAMKAGAQLEIRGCEGLDAGVVKQLERIARTKKVDDGSGEGPVKAAAGFELILA
jgi:hypothetical protein